MDRFRPTVDSVSQTGGHSINPVDPNVSRPDLPAEYQGLLDANPYMNLDYRESGWQKFLSSLGFRTGYDKRMEDIQLQAQEYNAQVAQMAFQNQYNTPEAQSQRMRAAGMNPDMLGTGDVAGAASMGEDTNPPAPTETDMDTVVQLASVGSSILDGVSTAIGFAKDFVSMEQIDLLNAQTDLNFGADSFSSLFPDEILENGQIRTDLAHDVLLRGSERSRSLKPRARARYMKNLENFVGSMDFATQAYQKASSKLGSKSEYFGSLSSPGSDLNQTTLILAKMLRDIAETNKLIGGETERSELRARGNEADVRGDVAEATDPTLQAEAINQTNRNTKARQSLEASLVEPVSQGMEKLEDSARNGNRSSALAVLGISIASVTSPLLAGVLRTVQGFKRAKKFGRKK